MLDLHTLATALNLKPLAKNSLGLLGVVGPFDWVISEQFREQFGYNVVVLPVELVGAYNTDAFDALIVSTPDQEVVVQEAWRVAKEGAPVAVIQMGPALSPEDFGLEDVRTAPNAPITAGVLRKDLSPYFNKT